MGVHHRVLVADDNLSNQLIFGHLLRKAGFETSVVSSGDAALDQLSAKGDFDALLIDLCMPELSGTEAIKLIRFQEVCEGESGRLPVIAISADDRAATKQDCLSAGADAFLAHPISSETLVQTLTNLIEAREESLPSPIDNVVHLKDRLEYRPASNRNLDVTMLEEVFSFAGKPGVRDFANAIKTDVEVALNYMHAAVASGDIEGFKAAITGVLSSTASLGANGVKSVHHYAGRLESGYLKTVGPLIIARLEYEAQVIIDALERFIVAKTAGMGDDGAQTK
ncbi:response regulator [Acidisoma sp. L85]|uniref:response regulator n=1 Tax=Acidisoma sp. L85 TaxID=1641850 RepID=UPI00131E98F0|nr:response regulator [Acidisoma sp. L85]